MNEKFKIIANYKLVILWVLIVLINSYVALKYMKVPVFTDENGTMANGAMLSGAYDWSDAYSTSVSMYWGYGYSVLWAPLFWAFDDMFLVYKLIGVFNAIIVAFIPIIIYRILNEFFPDFPYKYWITLLISFYPTGFVVSKFAWNEPMFLLLQWIILYLLFKTYQSNDHKIIYSIWLSLACVYACTVHERGIIFFAVILFVFIVVYFRLKEKIISIIPFLFVFILGYGIHKEIKEYIVSNLLAVDASMARNTAESLITVKTIAQIFDFHNILQMLIGVICQGYYIVISSLGLISIVVISFFVLLKCGKKNNKRLFLFSVYANALIAVTLIVSVVFYYKSYITSTTRGVEYYFYGRYNESSICVGILISILFVFYVWKNKLRQIVFCMISLVSGFTGIVVVILANKVLSISKQMFNENNVYFLLPFGTRDMATNTSINDFIQISILIILIVIIVAVLTYLRHYKISGIFLVALFLYVSEFFTDSYLIKRNQTQYDNIAELVQNDTFNNITKDITFDTIYLTDVSTRTLTMQLVFPSYNVYFLNTKTFGYQQLKEIGEDSLIMSMKNEQFEKWLENCNFVGEIGKYFIWHYSSDDFESHNTLINQEEQKERKTLKTAYEREQESYSIIVNNYQSGVAIIPDESCIATQTCIFIENGTIEFPDRVFLQGEYELQFYGNELEDISIEIRSKELNSDSVEILEKEYQNNVCTLRLKFSESLKDVTISISNENVNSSSYFTELDIYYNGLTN